MKQTSLFPSFGAEIQSLKYRPPKFEKTLHKLKLLIIWTTTTESNIFTDLTNVAAILGRLEEEQAADHESLCQSAVRSGETVVTAEERSESNSRVYDMYFLWRGERSYSFFNKL